MRKAALADLPQVVGLMQAFYAEAGYTLHPEQATSPLAALLADEQLGAIWLLEAAGRPVGYLALTWCFSLEYGGRKAILDDFFVEAAYRGTGLGAAALAALPDLCRTYAVRAVAVEVGTANERAQRAYRRAGFAPTPDRELLTLALAAPTHEY